MQLLCRNLVWRQVVATSCVETPVSAPATRCIVEFKPAPITVAVLFGSVRFYSVLFLFLFTRRARSAKASGLGWVQTDFSLVDYTPNEAT